MLTLRQVEVVRAVIVTGSIAAAARLLNVSAPGLSRLVKHAEASLGFPLFDRRQGRLVPGPRAGAIFERVEAVNKAVGDLREVVARSERGSQEVLRIASVPSIAGAMVPRAIVGLRRHHADLVIDVNILKIEEAVDYLVLGRGELVAISSLGEHPSLLYEPLAEGRLYAIVPDGHALAGRASVTAAEIARHPLIGIDAGDPYGRIMADLFARAGVPYEVGIRARFGSTVCALVRAGLGVGVIDGFTLAHDAVPGVVALAIDDPTPFRTYLARRRDVPLSRYAALFARLLREEMRAAPPPNGPRRARPLT